MSGKAASVILHQTWLTPQQLLSSICMFLSTLLRRFLTGIRKISCSRIRTLKVLYVEDTLQFYGAGSRTPKGMRDVTPLRVRLRSGAGFLSEGRCPALVLMGKEEVQDGLWGLTFRLDLEKLLIQWSHCHFRVKLSHSWFLCFRAVTF